MDRTTDKNIKDFVESREEQHDAASALVVSKDYKNELVILLLKHPKIGKLIPIGGHVKKA